VHGHRLDRLAAREPWLESWFLSLSGFELVLDGYPARFGPPIEEAMQDHVVPRWLGLAIPLRKPFHGGPVRFALSTDLQTVVASGSKQPRVAVASYRALQ